MSEAAHESVHSVEEVALERALDPVHQPAGASIARFASGMGNQAFGSMVGGITPAPRAAIAREDPPGRPPMNPGATGGATVGVAVSSKGVKFTPEVTGTREFPGPMITTSVSATAVGEAELTWKDDPNATYYGAKGSAKQGGEKGGSAEADVPLYQNKANQELAKKKDKAFEDHFKFTDVNVVFGKDAATKPAGEEGPASGEFGPTVALKAKNVKNEEYTFKVTVFSIKAGAGGKLVDWSGPKAGAEADIPVLAPEDPWDLGGGWKLNGKLSVKPGVEIKPNYTAIWQHVARMGLAGVIEMAGTMAVIFAPAIAAWSAFSMNAEKAALMDSIMPDGKKAKATAEQIAWVLSGGEPYGETGKDPSVTQASNYVTSLCETRGVSREAFKEEVRRENGYGKIRDRTLGAAKDEFAGTVRKRIHEWWEANDWYDDSKEADKQDKSWYERIRIGSHLSFWMLESDFQLEAQKRVNMAWEERSGLAALSG